LIATEVRRTNVKDPNSIRFEDVDLTFTKSSSQKKPPTEEEIKIRTAIAKASWAGFKKVKP
jgi:hypothetical protein